MDKNNKSEKWPHSAPKKIKEENMEKHRNRETRDSKLQFLCPSINFQKLLRFLDLLRRYARLGVANATNDQRENPGEFQAVSSNLPTYSASAHSTSQTTHAEDT